MSKPIFNVISGDGEKDEFMHRFDVFESFKRYGECWSVEYTAEIPLDRLAICLQKLKHSIETADKPQRVTAIWVAKHPEINYVDWSIKSVSDGTKWFVLASYLKQFGITTNLV